MTVYFIEYLLNQKEDFSEIRTNILENIELIITPMTNAVGYFRNQREELIDSNESESKYIKSFDINRDFPFNQDEPYNCLNTIGARIVYKIYTQNNIQGTLTFHGGDNNISYPWGAPSRSHMVKGVEKGYTAPDYNLFQSFGL